MNLNLRLAEIDGKCKCDKPETEQPLYPACLSCNKDLRPDYLAPENRHELERIAENVCLTYRHIWNDGHSYVLFAHGLTVGEGHSDKQSYALAQAIMEAKG